MDEMKIENALDSLGDLSAYDNSELAKRLASLLGHTWMPISAGSPRLGARSVIWKHKNGNFHMGGNSADIKKNAVAWFEFDDYVEPESRLMKSVKVNFFKESYTREEIIAFMAGIERETRS